MFLCNSNFGKTKGLDPSPLEAYIKNGKILIADPALGESIFDPGRVYLDFRSATDAHQFLQTYIFQYVNKVSVFMAVGSEEFVAWCAKFGTSAAVADAIWRMAPAGIKEAKAIWLEPTEAQRLEVLESIICSGADWDVKDLHWNGDYLVWTEAVLHYRRFQLTKGARYDRRSLHHLGWAGAEIANQDGLLVENFFTDAIDSVATYLGPNERGIEPVFYVRPV